MRTAFQDIRAVNAVGLIAWRCFAKQTDLMCSCTILTEKYVVARSGCMKTTTADKIEVYAGATHPENADQVVPASILNTEEAAPEGIVVLELEKELKFDDHVRFQASFHISGAMMLHSFKIY